MRRGVRAGTHAGAPALSHTGAATHARADAAANAVHGCRAEQRLQLPGTETVWQVQRQEVALDGRFLLSDVLQVRSSVWSGNIVSACSLCHES